MQVDYQAIIRFCVALLVILGLSIFACNRGCNSLPTFSFPKKDSTSTQATKPLVKIDSNVIFFPAKTMSDSAEKLLDPQNFWPVKLPPILPGSLLPQNRILAYYGNLFATKMGVLGEYPKAQMIGKLLAEKQQWAAADLSHPVQLALHAVVTTAQGKPGADGKYRLRMNERMVDTLLVWAKEINAVVFIDIQTGRSDLMTEVPIWEKYLKMPNVHLGIDPEFCMKNNDIPGKRVGLLTDTDINWTINYLKNLVVANNIPPKVLVVHRFKQDMVGNPQNIKPFSEVQFVLDMDGWGSKELKLSTQLHCIYPAPIEFTGFKLFYKNDIRGKGWSMMTPQEVVSIYPTPLYIQYQ